MTNVTQIWKAGAEISSADHGIPVRQVYVWMLTTDDKVVVVSKDGDAWQLPGGKPELNETLIETAVREVDEETGVDISAYRGQLECFGYYIVNEPDASPDNYLQVRMLLNLPVRSEALNLHVANESNGQAQQDMIRFARAVSVQNVVQYITWMPTTDEYRYLVDNQIINQ